MFIVQHARKHHRSTQQWRTVTTDKYVSYTTCTVLYSKLEIRRAITCKDVKGKLVQAPRHGQGRLTLHGFITPSGSLLRRITGGGDGQRGKRASNGLLAIALHASRVRDVTRTGTSCEIPERYAIQLPSRSYVDRVEDICVNKVV